MPQFNWTPQTLFSLTHETWKASAVQAGLSLGLFGAIAALGAGATAAKVAQKAKTDPRATAALLTALVALELVERAGETFSLPEFSLAYLVEESPDYFGHILLHTGHLAPAWANLAQTVKSGKKHEPPVLADAAAREAWEKKRFRSFLMGMYNVASLQAPLLAQAVDLAGAQSLLDLGGGPGTYAAAFCAANPNLKAVVFDRPGSAELAQEVLAKYQVADRVSFVGGDFLESPLPQGFDAVWLSQVLHGESAANALKLVQRAAETLKAGGKLFIQEFVLDDDRRGPLGPALFALNMLLQTDGGAAYAYGEIREMMEKANIASVREISAPLPPGNRVLWGVRAA
ncbi:MAG: methyltransferase domain-containing protein [Deltaproteobacteria bacterium]|jgi:predicted O-methyltransferase YrrM/F0F1-type ATP synthase membrane subunit c/vacuolar-type H+-ATPase subunit K|nr:methyltransferase domain-containing protein [Deltaproteobacteria bacterium]